MVSILEERAKAFSITGHEAAYFFSFPLLAYGVSSPSTASRTKFLSDPNPRLSSQSARTRPLEVAPDTILHPFSFRDPTPLSRSRRNLKCLSLSYEVIVPPISR